VLYAVLAAIVAAVLAPAAVLTRPAPVRRAARRRRRARLPRRVARTAVTDNLAAVLDEIVAGMQRPGLRGGAIFLINERNELYFGAHRGLADETVRDIRLPVGQGVVGGVAAGGRSVVIDDLDAPPPGVVPTNRATGSNALTRSMMAVPVLVQGSVLGVLEMGCAEPHAFDAADVALLEEVAAAVAGAIARANPLKLADEVLRRRVRELSALQETAQVLNASLGLEVVLDAVAERSARLLRTPYAAVHRVDAVSVHNVGAWRQQPEVDGAAADAAVADVAREVRPGETRMLALPAPPGVELPVTDPRAPMRSLAVVRLPEADGFDALLAIASPDARGFDPAQQRLLEGIAHLAGLAVANAVRYRHLARVASTDPLTGLLRRSQFERELAACAGETVSVLAIDVDHLREVNDSAGHEMGDLALRAIAHTLRDRLASLGTVARTAGDEFGVILPGCEGATAIAIAEELRRSVHAAPVMVPWLPRASVGLATAEPDDDPRAAWDAAIEGLAQAKRWGRDRVEVRRVVSGALVAQRQARDALVPQLFEDGRIEAAYQPVVRLSDRHLVGYEALARLSGFPLDTDVDGLFAAARAAGLHRDLDWACRRAAVRSAAALPPDLPLFLNVSAWALIDPLHGVDQMLLLLEWMGIDPARVVLELSEREAIHDLERLGEVMDAYRAEGIRFSIDDVGEGHSTLDMLAAGAPEFIKIARSLVSAADHAGARAAINAVVAFARSSGATVVAEGVETPEEAARMMEMGVSLGQGWWLGAPVRLPSAGLPGAEVRGVAAEVDAEEPAALAG